MPHLVALCRTRPVSHQRRRAPRAALVLRIVCGVLLAFAGQIAPVEASSSSITIEPLAPVQVGQNASATVVAHLSADGAPLSGARLQLLLDGVQLGDGVTDASGTAQLRFRHDLVAGEHQLEVRFDGSHSVAPGSASQPLTVQPASASTLTIEPLPPLQVGQNETATVVAHLVANGTPVPGARLQLVVDGVPAGGAATDAGGTAQLRFRRELAAGEHKLEVRFEGTRSIAATRLSSQFTVQPSTTTAVTLDPLPTLKVGRDATLVVVGHLTADTGQPVAGARVVLLVDGAQERTAATDADGTAQLRFRRELPAGAHAVEVRFEGSRGVAPASATDQLIVLPVDVGGLSIEPLPPLKVGQDPTTLVVAHLATDSGEPVPGGRLELVVDGMAAGSGMTDADGTAQLRFRRELAPGEHQLEVRSEGSRTTAPASATLELVVLPATPSGLTLDPLPTLKIGQDSIGTVVAHLAAETGEPVTGARLDLLVDGIVERGGSTDATGSARLQFRRELTAGEHRVEVRFGGSRSVAPGTTSTTFLVQPAELEVQVIPPLPGVRISANEQIFTSGNDGIVRLELSRVGAYHLEVLPWESTEPGMQVQFSRWADEVFVPTRDVVIPQTTRLQVGFDTSYFVGLSYLDPTSNPVSLDRIRSAVLSSSVGAQYPFRPGEMQWLPGSRIVRRANGLEETRLLYSVESVDLEGANVVNSKEQRFYLTPHLEFPVQLLLFSMRIEARDALFGHQVGTGLALTHPDGHTERYAFGLDRDVALQLLPRGAYTAAVEAQGIAFPQPIALSKDQDVALKVLTYLDVVAAGILLGTVAAGLLFFGRPWILRLPWSRVAFLGRPAVAVLVLAAGRLGRGRPGA